MKERVKQIQSIIEKYVEARLYWDESELDGGPDAYLVGVGMAASKIARMFEQEIADLEERRKATY